MVLVWGGLRCICGGAWSGWVVTKFLMVGSFRANTSDLDRYVRMIWTYMAPCTPVLGKSLGNSVKKYGLMGSVGRPDMGSSVLGSWWGMFGVSGDQIF